MSNDSVENKLIEPYGGALVNTASLSGTEARERYIEIFVDTRLEVCEQRVVKGMYALAREGKLKNFTGIDDPYEPPLNPEIALDTVSRTAEENAEQIIVHLVERGFLLPAARSVEATGELAAHGGRHLLEVTSRG